MDAFQILSRSGKFSKSSTARGGSADVKPPSNGQARNPQLFGASRDAKAANGLSQGKRKRDSSEANGSASLTGELDFFREKHTDSTVRTSMPSRSIRKDHESSSDLPDTRDDVGVNYGLDLPEEDCKRILREHKIKVTLLASSDAAARKKSKSLRKQGKTTRQRHGGEEKEEKQLLPQPLTSFEHLRTKYRISRRLAENLQNEGYCLPTEVQMGTLPLLLDHPLIGDEEGMEGLGQPRGTGTVRTDLLTVAPTGSGKTLAFLIPSFESLVLDRRKAKGQAESPEVSERCGVKGLVIAPTKELADQIVNEGRKLATGTGIRIAGMRKGMRVLRPSGVGSKEPVDASENNPDASEEDDGDEDDNSRPLVKADVLVTTPLIFLHSITDDSSHEVASLPSIKFLILDEADVLLDPLFRSQTLGIWNACSNPSLRVSLWSATMGSNIESLAKSTILSHRTSADTPPWRLVRLVVGLKDTALPTISHRLTYAATEQGKLLALRHLLHPTTSHSSAPPPRPPFLVFTQTIPRATALHSELLYDISPFAGGSSRLAVLHAGLPDAARASIMARVRSGEVWILITTDLLSRGVDFRGINAVINYDVPTSAAAYVHRVGRTGRAGREGGVAVTLYTRDDVPHVKNVANVIAASEKARGATSGAVHAEGEGEDVGVQKWLLDALPTPSKNDKKRLKKRGVEARRAMPERGEEGKGQGQGQGKSRARISTKSGFDRRVENNRRGAVETTKRRLVEGEDEEGEDNGGGVEVGNGEESEWAGFDE
ncbi:MAG: RNA-dependent ATPase rok1 [Piccolia ochrophora]|nr:MAG: RNA-dependent ATPase rok1 [Piccolia ochrophora]